MEVDGPSELNEGVPEDFSSAMSNEAIPLPAPPGCSKNSPLGESSLSSSAPWKLPAIDYSNTQSEKSQLQRFITYLDQIDTKVEKLRKEALDLQDQKDSLLVSIDLIKNHEQLPKMNEFEQEEVNYYIKRVGSRLSTVELCVKTVRDKQQEESLHQVNMLIDSLINSGDPIMSRQRCQTFLNACSATDMSIQRHLDNVPAAMINIDKKFENFLLGCTLDDQKNIKKRLCALVDYLNRQIVTD